MAGLGAATGGPMGMKSESFGSTDISQESKMLLNTYIHNYFVEEGLGELAKGLRGSKLTFDQNLLKKGGPGSEDAMDTDSKDDSNNRLDGLPGSNAKAGQASHNFLPNWWGIFFDMWSAARKKDNSETSSAQYLAAIQRSRQQQSNQQQLMQQTMINPRAFTTYQTMPNNPMNLQKRVMVNNGIHPAINNNNINNMRMQQQMNPQNHMQRDGSDIDMNGAPRGPSPRPGENAPSPKRQRVDSGASNFQRMGPNTRPVAMVQQPQNGNAPNAPMLIGEFGTAVSPAFNPLNNQQKSVEQYSQDLVNQQRISMHQLKGVPVGTMAQGSPLMAAGPDGHMMNADIFAQNGYNTMRQPGMPGAGGHGGALADYQMQLMLLEQQNKKRLMMARQEQDVAQREQGVPQGLMGQPGSYAPPMSPRASRTGHSPNSDPTKRGGTPKMGQDSPLPDNPMGGRGSPGGNFEPGQMQPNMMPPFMGGGPVGGPNGMMLRQPNMANVPLNPQQIDMMRRQQLSMQNGAWAPGMQNPNQMLQQGMQHPQMEASQPRNNAAISTASSMPPPQGPPAGRTQPSSPQTQAAPPTPSQTNKAPPKKKDSKDSKKKPAKKAAPTTGATPNAEVEQSDDVPPPTPSTPKNTASSIIKGNAPMNIPSQPNAPMPPVMGMPHSLDNNVMAGPFGSLDTANDMSTFVDNFDDLLGQDNTDVLQGFDFEAFLHNEPVNGGLDFDTQYFGGDGLETGLGD